MQMSSFCKLKVSARNEESKEIMMEKFYREIQPTHERWNKLEKSMLIKLHIQRSFMNVLTTIMIAIFTATSSLEPSPFILIAE